MFSGRNRRRGFALRAAVVVAAAGALALSASGTAFAKSNHDTTLRPKSAPTADNGAGKIGRGDRVAVVKDNKGDHTAPIVVITLTFADGTAKKAYCIDFEHTADHTGNEYDPGKWDESNVKNLPKIQWILTNSFPHKDATPLLKDAGVTDTAGLDAEFVAYAATQTAIWHYSDGVEITGNGKGGNKDLSAEEYAAVEKTRQYLIDKAGNTPEPPAPAVGIDPQQTSGHAGDKIGPFTVTANGTVTSLKLAASGDAKLVDADGNDVQQVENGSTFFVVSQSTGQVTLSAEGTGTLPTGQVFLAKNGPHKFQKLILADTATKNVQAQATVTVTTKPSPSPSPSSASPSAPAASPSASGTAGGGLPVTGTSLPIIVGVALVLLVGGGAAVVFARRRRLTQ